MAALFAQDHTFPKAYVHHLWAGKTWQTHLAALSLDSIYASDTTYHRLARRYVSRTGPSDA